jgi:hypothetical protein
MSCSGKMFSHGSEEWASHHSCDDRLIAWDSGSPLTGVIAVSNVKYSTELAFVSAPPHVMRADQINSFEIADGEVDAEKRKLWRLSSRVMVSSELELYSVSGRGV